MSKKTTVFFTPPLRLKLFTWGDFAAILLITGLITMGVRMALNAPEMMKGPQISISPSSLPYYTALSIGRMLVAYLLSLGFTLWYGRWAAYSPRAERYLMPLLDVLQSVPILSFLPVVLLGLSAFLPEGFSAEIASIVLIFTSQVWNLTFAWYQSLTTIPTEFREAASIFRLNAWMKFKNLELPFGMISLVWNSMMSWAGGWFFLMAAETFTVGSRDFRLPGLGSYLQAAANQNNYQAIAWGITALILVVLFLDQLVWRPLLAWSDKFKVEMVESDHPPQSWFYDLIRPSFLIQWASIQIFQPLNELLDQKILHRFPFQTQVTEKQKPRQMPEYAFIMVLFTIALFILYWAGDMLLMLPLTDWLAVLAGVGLTLLRVMTALLIALLWTIPAGVAIGTNQRLAAILQPIVQVTASVPATALFPVILLLFVDLPGGLNLAAIILMLMGTQWYLLFNIIAGASAIPQDLKYTAQLMPLTGWQRWRTLILPAIFPYLITGAITASGGAWNASIVAEYQHLGGQTLSVNGIGSLIAQATALGNYPLLLAATLSMVLSVIVVNRLLWRRLYRLAEEKYRMEV